MAVSLQRYLLLGKRNIYSSMGREQQYIKWLVGIARAVPLLGQARHAHIKKLGNLGA